MRAVPFYVNRSSSSAAAVRASAAQPSGRIVNPRGGDAPTAGIQHDRAMLGADQAAHVEHADTESGW